MSQPHLDGTERFTLSSPQVVADLVDGEVVAVNLETGTYFAMYSTSAQIWAALIAGCSLAEIAIALEQSGEASNISQSQLWDFANELLKHELLEHAKIMGAEDPTALSSLRNQSERAPLRLHVHADLQDILLLDPVHDTNSSGWPEAK